MRQQIDEVVKRMLQEAYTEAKALLAENIDALHKIAAFLIEKETITGKEFMEIYHKVLKEREAGETAEAGEASAHEAEDAGEASAHEAEDAGEASAHEAEDAGEASAHEAEDAGEAAVREAEDIGKASAHETKDVGESDV